MTTRQPDNPTYSVVIPCYNSSASIEELLNRIVTSFDQREDTFEVICVDDASTDNVGDLIREYREKDKRVKLIHLSKNVGQHAAIHTGLQFVNGKYIITIDDDLQNPPEEISKLISSLEDHDAVLGIPKRKKQTTFRNFGSWMILRVTQSIFNLPRGFASSSFRIMHRHVADNVAAMSTVYPYISGMIFLISQNVGNVTVEHHERAHGKSGYTLVGLLRLSSNLIINYSKLPLHFLTLAAVALLLISISGIAYLIVRKVLYAEYLLGWTSLMVLISFLGSFNLLAFAIIGQYVIRVLNEISGARKPIIREILIDS
ncbi:glycosyltransferase family 2 protein [Calditrichota bacterium]